MPRKRLVFNTWPAAIYAIGDVHGCLPQLLALEADILDHEQMFLDFLADPMRHAYWLEQGGLETLDSYGVELDLSGPQEELIYALREAAGQRIPRGHLRFLADLPSALSLPGWLFVHAGIRPGLPLDWQTDEDLIWIREPFLDTERHDGLRVVHGHTPAEEPVVTPNRICIDTWCFETGRLTGLRVTPDGETQLFSMRG